MYTNCKQNVYTLMKKLNFGFLRLPIHIQHDTYRTHKTSKEVEPAEINGSGNPVGGIKPVNTSYCTFFFS